MRTSLSVLLLGLLGSFFVLQASAEDGAALNALSSSRSIRVEANRLFTATGTYASSGESFLILADGNVDISAFNGGYRTNPDGTISNTPPADSGAFTWFRDTAGPLNTDPVLGSRKSLLELGPDWPAHLPGAPYGALVAGFSASSSPSSFDDFPNGFAVVGTYGIVRAPNTGGYLFLGVNDLNSYEGGDNTGAFRADIFRLR